MKGTIGRRRRRRRRRRKTGSTGSGSHLPDHVAPACLPAYVDRYVLCSPPVCVTHNYGVYPRGEGEPWMKGGEGAGRKERTKEKVDEEETENESRRAKEARS